MRDHFPVIILLAAFFLRLTDLLSFPVFIDEATYVHWARLFAANTPSYPAWMEGRILAVMWMSLFDLTGAAPLWLARAAVALLSVMNCAACLTLGRWMGGRVVGWIAGGLYAALPYALFHDRQAITDPVATALGSVVLVCALGLARTRRWPFVVPLGVPLGLAFAAAALAKFNAAQYPLVFVLAVIFIPRRDRVTLALQFGAALLVSAAAIAAFVWLLGPRLGGGGGGILADSTLSQQQCPPALCEGDWAEQWRRLPLALNSLPEVVPPYFGWPLLAAAVVGALRPPLPAGEGPGVRANSRHLTVTLALTVLLMLLAVIVTMRSVVVPRYMGFMVVPLLVLAANGLGFFFNRRNALAGALALGIIALSFRNSFTLLTAPAQVELPAIDRQQYLTGFYSGIGFREIATVVAGEPQPLILTKTAWQALPLNAYLDAHRVQAIAATEARWPAVKAALAEGRGVYVVEEIEGDAPAGAEVLFSLDRGGDAKALRLNRFTEAAALFDIVFQRPDAFLASYDQLLADTPAKALLVPYPPHQAALLKERTGLAVHDLRLQPELPNHTLVRTVFLDDARFDPERAFEHRLAVDFFHLGARWYGPLRVVDWAGAVELDRVWQTDITFGETIVLRTVEVAEAAARPGEPLRARLTFAASAPTAIPYKIFVHLIRDDQIISQHDGQPAGDLRPTDGWRAGQVIADQIALQIPADFAPGEARLRIGLYDPVSGARLLTLDGAEFYVSPQLSLP